MIFFIFYLNKKIENVSSSLDNKITNLEHSIKLTDYKYYLLNQQFKTIFSYIFNFKNESSIYKLLSPRGISGKKKVRIGANSDGGYILLDDFENVKIAYSFGISTEISFDKALADKNIDVYMYDHTIEKLPFSNLKFHWKKVGITDQKGIKNNMKTLSELIKDNGHINENNIILKMDIEGSEWDIFNNIREDILLQFKYILVEFHFRDEFKSIYSKVFKKLNKSHQIFHLHCNNCCPIINFDGYMICSALEVSYIIKANNTFIPNLDSFPVKNIDYVNVKEQLDINFFLNMYSIDNLFIN